MIRIDTKIEYWDNITLHYIKWQDVIFFCPSEIKLIIKGLKLQHGIGIKYIHFLNTSYNSLVDLMTGYWCSKWKFMKHWLLYV